MKSPIKNQGGEIRKRCTGESAYAGTIVLALVSFLIGLVLGALWFSPKVPAQIASVISDQTDRVNGADRINSPIGSTTVPTPASAPQVDPAALDEVKRTIPNPESASVATGTRLLRKAALAKFEQTVLELQARQKEAEQKLIQEKSTLSKEQQEIAIKQLQVIQAEQMKKLKEIAAGSEAQIDAFQQLKVAAQQR